MLFRSPTVLLCVTNTDHMSMLDYNCSPLGSEYYGALIKEPCYRLLFIISYYKAI
jgi:hypothetical protein